MGSFDCSFQQVSIGYALFGVHDESVSIEVKTCAGDTGYTDCFGNASERNVTERRLNEIGTVPHESELTLKTHANVRMPCR